MTSTCSLCGKCIHAPEDDPLMVTTDADRAYLAVRNFDLLAGRIASHIAEQHPEQHAEMTAVMFLAGKLCATRWARSHTAPTWNNLLFKWADQIMLTLEPVYLETATDPSTQAAAESGTAEPAVGSPS